MNIKSLPYRHDDLLLEITEPAHPARGVVDRRDAHMLLGRAWLKTVACDEELGGLWHPHAGFVLVGWRGVGAAWGGVG